MYITRRRTDLFILGGTRRAIDGRTTDLAQALPDHLCTVSKRTLALGLDELGFGRMTCESNELQDGDNRFSTTSSSNSFHAPMVTHLRPGCRSRSQRPRQSTSR
jgi:hypothetical protein